ncbi:hypothetical protein V1478_013292 [Vespula squamosa]|uniref:Uncharacterized protein n=1 Tax=Vespula squamosa TaxID=30214 RepID=A0ABD2AB65_VESSQ
MEVEEDEDDEEEETKRKRGFRCQEQKKKGKRKNGGKAHHPGCMHCRKLIASDNTYITALASFSM